MTTLRVSFIFSVFGEIIWSYFDALIQPSILNNEEAVLECNISISKCSRVVSKYKRLFWIKASFRIDLNQIIMYIFSECKNNNSGCETQVSNSD